MAVREASHAGSWYSDNGSQLAAQLDHWLAQVPEDNVLPGSRIPLPGARVVISPHAGYAYSGPCAGWAYKCLDLSKAKRIFILHPSHHHHLSTAALPTVQAYETPLSDDPLPLDHGTIQQLSTLSATSSQGRPVRFTTMSQAVDEAEHSAEMQLPYIHRLLQKLHPGKPSSSYPPLVPIMIGGTNPAIETAIGKLLAPYIADEANAFIISSDFCHWGSRFGYTYYLSDAPSPAISPLTLPNGVTAEPATTRESGHEDTHKTPTLSQGESLRSGTKLPRTGPKICDSIAHADRACMCAIATGQYCEFLRVLQQTGNTVCGRHPIGVFMAGWEEVERLEKEKQASLAQSSEADVGRGRFRFMRYERSSDVERPSDSSVSYVSAFAVL